MRDPNLATSVLISLTSEGRVLSSGAVARLLETVSRLVFNASIFKKSPLVLTLVLISKFYTVYCIA